MYGKLYVPWQNNIFVGSKKQILPQQQLNEKRNVVNSSRTLHTHQCHCKVTKPEFSKIDC